MAIFEKVNFIMPLSETIKKRQIVNRRQDFASLNLLRRRRQ